MLDFLSEFLITLLVSGVVIVCQILSLVIYTYMFYRILAKDRSWLRGFFGSLCSIVLLALVMFYITGRMNYTFDLLEGDMALPKGAFFGYLGFSFMLQALAIGLAVLKYFWSLIRHKQEFYWEWLALEILFIAVNTAVGVFLFRIETKLPIGKNMDLVYIAAACLLSYGIYRCLSGIKLEAGDSAPAPHAQAEAAAVTQATKDPSVPDAVYKRYMQIMDDRKRLEKEGNYTAEIQLLLEATGLPVEGSMKATVWVCLGVAYENTGSIKRSIECYQTALKFEKDNPWALNNLALLKSEAGEHETARQYMKTAIDEVLKRGKNPAKYYANYAQITGLAGYREEAEEYLKKSASLGYSADIISRIRKRVGLN